MVKPLQSASAVDIKHSDKVELSDLGLDLDTLDKIMWRALLCLFRIKVTLLKHYILLNDSFASYTNSSILVNVTSNFPGIYLKLFSVTVGIQQRLVRSKMFCIFILVLARNLQQKLWGPTLGL